MHDIMNIMEHSLNINPSNLSILGLLKSWPKQFIVIAMKLSAIIPLLLASLVSSYWIQTIPQNQQQAPFLVNYVNLQSNIPQPYATLVATAPQIHDYQPDYLQTVYIPSNSRKSSGPQIESVHSSDSIIDPSIIQSRVVTNMSIEDDTDEVGDEWDTFEPDYRPTFLQGFDKAVCIRVGASLLVMAIISGIIILIAVLNRHRHY